MDAAPLDAIDVLELAELLDFTADALSWHAGSVVYPDLQAHLRRWVRRLGPDTPGWTWARPPTPPPPLDTATQAVLGSDVGSPDRRDELGKRPSGNNLAGIDQPESPCCHDAVTMRCPVCQAPFVPVGRQTYCGDACRAAAYRRRRDAHNNAPVVVPKGKPRRPITVYECDDCGERALGDQYCQACSNFMRRVGVGGCCPTCDAPVAIAELQDLEVIA